MNTAGELLYAFAQALSVPEESLEAIKNNADLFKITIPKELGDNYTKNFTTLDSAKQNGELKKHFYGLSLKPIDSKLDEVMTEFGLDDEAQREIKSQDSTYKRNEALIRKLHSISTKAAAATTSKDKDKFQEEITKLNSQILANQTQFQAQLAEAEGKWVNKVSGMIMDSKINERPLTDQFPRDVVVMSAKGLIEKRANDKGAKIVFDKDNMKYKLVQAANPDLEYTENHKGVSFDDFRDTVLAENKLLKVSGTTPVTPANVARTPSQPERPMSPMQQRIKAQQEADYEAFKNAPKDITTLTA